MSRHDLILTDAQWQKIEPLLPRPKRNPKGGRPPADTRLVLEGILWILKSGARWRDLPERFPSPATCWRRLRDWEDADIWLTIWRAFLTELDEEGRINWAEVFADGTFSPAKKGETESARPSVERGRSLWWWRTARVFLWEFNSPRRPRAKSNSSSRHLPKQRSSRWGESSD